MSNLNNKPLSYGNLSRFYNDLTTNKLNGIESSIDSIETYLEGKQDVLIDGENIEIVDNTVSAIGYAAGNSWSSNFVELPEIVIEPYIDMTSMLGNNLYFTGVAGTTTYTISGQLAAMIGNMIGVVAFQISSGNIALLTAYDSTNSTVTLNKTLDANNALSNTQMSKLYMVVNATISGAAGAITYSFVGDGIATIFTSAQKIKIGDYPIATIVSVDSTNNTITLSETLDASNAVSNAQFMYAIQVNNTATGGGSHAEGSDTTASGVGSHAEGSDTTASGLNSHAEGWNTTASGERSHTEGISTTAQNTTEHAEGYVNVSHKASDTYGNSGNTQHSVGILNKNAIEIMQNGDIYVYGVGGYQGTNTTVQDSTIKTLQAYIASLEARIAALEGN